MEKILENVIKNTALAKAVNNDSSDSSISYEVALPIVFIVLFLVMLVMTYFVREVVVKKKKFCLSKSRNTHNFGSRNTSYPMNGNADYSLIRMSANYANPAQKLNESCQYYEEPRAGYYHVQKLNSFNRNYNYEKIYSENFKRMPSHLMPPVAAVNKLSKIDETHSYGLPSIKNFEALNLNENSRMEISFNRNRSMNQYGSQTNVKEKQAKLKSENNRLRRSYSNSKLDIKKWQSQMTKQKPSYSKSKKWSSKIMSEHELKIFLSQNKKLRMQNVHTADELVDELFRMKKIQHKPVVVEEKLAAPSVLTSSTCKQSNEKKIKMKKSNSNGLQLVKALSVNLCDIKSNHVSFSFKDNTLVKLGQKLREKTSEKNISFKSNQNNYLKNLSAFKSKGFFSMTSIFEKVSSVSTWNKGKAEKVISSQINDSNNVTSDAITQSSSMVFSNSSSLNSQLTTMQTNNFGSIIANFGSANMKCSQTIKSKRHRTCSDINGLSASDSSQANRSDCKNIKRNTMLLNQNNMSVHSVSFTKLPFLKNRV